MNTEKLRKLTPAEKTFIDILYDKEFQNLCRYANKMVKNNFVAEDLAQDTFLIACIKADKLLTHPKPGGWLLETLQKHISNYWRVREYITKLIVDVPIEKWLENYPDDRFPEDELDFIYNNMVKYKEYEIIKKFAVDGYSQKEIAADYGISINTCKQRIYRAKKILQRLV